MGNISGIGWMVSPGDWNRVNQIFHQISSLNFAYNSTPTFAGLNLTHNLHISGGLTVTGGAGLTVTGNTNISGTLTLDTLFGLLNAASGTVSAIGVNATATRKFLMDVSSATPIWDTLQAGDIPGFTGTYLMLDQTTPQTVINGIPVFDKGLSANDNIVTTKSGIVKRLLAGGVLG